MHATAPAPRPRYHELGGTRLSRLRAWMADPLAALESARELGDVVVADLGPMQNWQLFRPEDIEAVLVRAAGQFNKDTRGYRAMRVALGQGLVTSEGDLWKRQRRIVQPAFHRDVIARMGEEMAACARDLARSWEAGGERDVAHDMMSVTLRIAGRTFFSVDLHGEADVIGGATADIVRQFLFHMSFPVPRPELLPTPGNLRYWRALRTLDREVNALVAARRAVAGERPHDLLSLLLDAEDQETGESMSDQQLRDELVTMLAAGHETTANALGWTLYLLAENPSEQARVAEELDRVLGGREPTAADAPKLERTWRAVLEAMRLYPPAWIHARRAAAPYDFGGAVIPAGAFAVLPQWAVHRDPRWWDEPTRYDPDRFLPERAAGRPKFAYFPFSGGQRKCIGDRFAELEAVLVLATLLQRFELRVTGRAPVPEPGVTLRPKTGIWLGVGRRAKVAAEAP